MAKKQYLLNTFALKGHKALNSDIDIPTEPKFAKLHKAYVEIMTDFS
jgi:hypothetical protein